MGAQDGSQWGKVGHAWGCRREIDRDQEGTKRDSWLGLGEGVGSPKPTWTLERAVRGVGQEVAKWVHDGVSR